MWIDDARLVYNTCVSKLSGTSEKADKYKIRNEFVIEKNTKQTDDKLLLSMKQTPKDIRAKASFEACAAHDLSLSKKYTISPKYKSYEKALKQDQKSLVSVEKKLSKRKKSMTELEDEIERLKLSIASLENNMEFTPKFMSKTSIIKKRLRKNIYAHIFIPKSSCKVDDNVWNIFPKYKVGPLIVKESDGKAPTSDFQIRWNRRLDSWCIVTSSEIVVKKISDNECRTISIDPGIRTFLTCLDVTTGNIEEFGKNWTSLIKNRVSKLDRCEKVSLDGKRGKERFNSLKDKRNSKFHRTKIRNIVNELHKKTAKILIDNYDVIILPKLRTKGILKKVGGIGKKNNRNISYLSHASFHDYLTWKAGVHDKIVIDQNEAFTTKTCYECGLMNDIGSSKKYVCNHCDNVCDRDVQSCFNILTRYMSSYSSTIEKSIGDEV
jgi:putative transposase